ncbi:BACON domain-containing protein [Sinomicrobium weinanense]|uniref:BACON domain-containing protein n=1 Tax=Sinomicrobium weinanense TaxID=2842200 RepID=A0A926JT17_9FLAO|nr:BACON domain-containing protein [Sinomicrobium weinanense]MBC9796834.1 BACON domain-containing protein [Sinomicrobium weinanense]MBU3125207.1 BACON domain-containing protein [Sinomicrobium weinanense]
MSKQYIFSIRKTSGRILALVLLLPLAFMSCKNDDDVAEDPYFMIEGDPSGLFADVKDTTQKYVVRSNQPWKVVGQEDYDWVRAFPDEGDDEGIFSIIVNENMTLEPRNAYFAIVVNGTEQPTLFSVEQKENVPYITLKDAESGYSIPATGGELTIEIRATVDWSYTVDDNDWLTEVEVSESGIVLQGMENRGDGREVSLTVSSPEYPDLDQTVTISQSSNTVILEEDFSWLSYGSAVPYVTTDEQRYDNWTQEEKDHGWESTPVKISSNQQIVYARQGFVKLGKTGVGGDLISPKLNIEGTADVKVTFKAAAYISKGGNVDDRILKVFALGAGETSVDDFVIDNIPNSAAEDDAGIENDIWAEDRVYSFIITGATSDTQVKFLGNDYDLEGVGQGKNRIFLDDIKVQIMD